MNCVKIVALLEDFHYGELDERSATKVASHLRDCEACRQASVDLETEHLIYQTYARKVERELETGPWVWQAVRARIAQSRQDRFSPVSAGARIPDLVGELRAVLSRPSWIRQAAFAVVLVTLSVMTTLMVVRFFGGARPNLAKVSAPNSTGTPSARDGQSIDADRAANRSEVAEPEAEVANRPIPRPRVSPASIQPIGSAREADLEQMGLRIARLKIRRAQRDYIDAIRILNAAVSQKKSTLDPQIAASLDRNLLIIDQTIAATRKAYSANPQDPDLAQYMLTAYAKKVELLEELAFSNNASTPPAQNRLN